MPPFRRSRGRGPRESTPDWHTFLMATHDRMRDEDPNSSFGEAMKRASAEWPEHQRVLGKIRRSVVRDLRKRSRKSPKEREELLERANHLETMNAANIMMSVSGRRH